MQNKTFFWKVVESLWLNINHLNIIYSRIFEDLSKILLQFLDFFFD
jgi:hypothetical protein